MDNNLKSTVLGDAKSPPAARMNAKLRAGAMALAVAGAMALASGVVGAAETTFAGYTDGCFGAVSCTPPATPATATQVITYGGLTYNNSTFSLTTAAGFVGIGGSPGTPNVDNLGSMTLSGLPFVYDGENFNVAVTFTAPPLVTPNPTTFTDVITGTVFSADNGGVFIDFDNTHQFRTFGAGSTAGTFEFWINDLSIVAGRQVAVTGTIISVLTAVPEPDTYALMLGGLGLMGFVARRRKLKAA